MAYDHDRVAAARPVRAVSPELALVDPVLAAEERSRWVAGPAFVHRPAQLHVPRLVARDDERSGLAFGLRGLVEHRLSVPLGLPAIRPRHVLAVAVSCTLVALAVAAVREPSESPDPAVVAQQEASPFGGETAGADPSPRTRRFAWAPVPGAERYEFELYEGSERVYAASSTSPQLAVPAHWTVDGAERTLVPGDYRWYVWAVVSGKRSSSAVVQASLTISST